MPSRITVVRVLCLIALAASGAGLGEVAFRSQAFCGFGAGCEEVAASAYSRVLGVPLPVVGLVGFGLVLGLSLVPNRRLAALVRPLSVVAGLTGLALVAIQLFVIGQICKVCLVADISAIGLAAVALLGRFPEPFPGVSWPRRLGWLVAAALVAGLPVGWSWAITSPPPPEQVLALRAPDGVTVVEVTDFDCPHCREADAALREALRGRDKVHLVRLVAPIPHHRNARPAGRAYIAAVRQGKAEEMAAALIAASDRSPERCRQLAGLLGLHLAAYDRVVNDPATGVEMDTTVAWARNAGPGLPLIWVQDRLLPGVPTVDALHAALDQASQK